MFFSQEHHLFSEKLFLSYFVYQHSIIPKEPCIIRRPAYWAYSVRKCCLKHPFQQFSRGEYVSYVQTTATYCDVHTVFQVSCMSS